MISVQTGGWASPEEIWFLQSFFSTWSSFSFATIALINLLIRGQDTERIWMPLTSPISCLYFTPDSENQRSSMAQYALHCFEDELIFARQARERVGSSSLASICPYGLCEQWQVALDALFVISLCWYLNSSLSVRTPKCFHNTVLL